MILSGTNLMQQSTIDRQVGGGSEHSFFHFEIALAYRAICSIQLVFFSSMQQCKWLDRSNMATLSSTAINYGRALQAIITKIANREPQGRWFIINHEEEDDPNTLAHFLHLCYTELEALLKEIGVFYMSGTCTRVDRQAMADLWQQTETVEYTVSKLAYGGCKPRDCHLIRIGAYSEELGPFSFFDQPDMIEQGLIGTKKPCFSDEHRLLRDYMRSLTCVETVTVASLKAPPCLEFRTPEKQGESPEVNIQPQVLFDTPTQELVGAKCILETIDMKDFPLLSTLKISFSTDFYLCALQREFDKLGDVIESVDLVNVVAANDKVHARVTVPQSGSWKSFSASMARTKWLFKA